MLIASGLERIHRGDAPRLSVWVEVVGGRSERGIERELVSIFPAVKPVGVRPDRKVEQQALARFAEPRREAGHTVFGLKLRQDDGVQFGVTAAIADAAHVAAAAEPVAGAPFGGVTRLKDLGRPLGPLRTELTLRHHEPRQPLDRRIRRAPAGQVASLASGQGASGQVAAPPTSGRRSVGAGFAGQFEVDGQQRHDVAAAVMQPARHRRQQIEVGPLTIARPQRVE